ncbi:protein xmas [Drosophila takahashii]|uniref:protein xmas n=1 Tax=Drosophila takahashii TaxID=29030 RepID=UPI001CF8707F|nr:protein xmas-2 [Drosophila takahashii]
MAEPRPGAYNYKTLLCTNIPELFLDKYVARSHFGRFGTLMNFVLRPRRMTCTVSYASEEEAELALLEGATFQGHQFGISYAESDAAPAQKTEEWVDPDVQAELSVLQSGWRSDYAASKPSAAAAPPPNPPKNPSPAARELENVMRRPAHTSEERYRVLEARDKLMRLNQAARKNQEGGGATQGHCPDMCPEKERVLREFQRQVAIYELQPGSDELICHERALKQYSRSSADQETPLPHELRDERALHMTMSYLMHEIMDISEQQESGHHMGDWFHFVWDRTRSIRKEITQQELCSLGAVKLVEQCARFHIHCAARLVAADPSVFDSKINAENLTKCLQTLKYMYHDLRLKGVQCPREAEFRGYIVLLNLADANFLWDIGQLPGELQSCPEVRQAIQFHLALQDTNFVRFFQLLVDEETSYLSACILVAYFTRLRVLALHRLIQAYRAPRKDEVSSLPLSYITDMLSFVSEQEAADFVQHYGLEVNELGRVVLSRMHTVETDYKLPRQIELVEMKRLQSVGEVICGEPLPPRHLYLDHRPHNSFNEHGVLKSVAWAAKDQLPGMEKEQQQQQQQEEKQQQQEEMPSPQNDNFFKVPLQPSGGGFSFALAEQQRRAQEEAKHQALQLAIAAAKEREAELMAIHEAKVAEAERRKLRERQEEQQRRQREKEEQQKLERQREQEKIELQLELQRQQKLEQLRQLEKQEREARKKAKTLESYQQIFHLSLTEICRREFQLHSQACRSYETLIDELTHHLLEQQMQQSLYELGIMRVYMRRWRNYRRAQQQKDTLFNQLPLSFGADESDRLVEERSVEDSLRLIRRYRLGEPCDYSKLLAGMEEQSWLKLDLWRVLDEWLPRGQPGARRFYKLLLSLPQGEVGFQLDYLINKGLLQHPKSPDAQLALNNDGCYIRGFSQGIALSVLKIWEGNQEKNKLSAANGIICLASVENQRQLPQRLKQLLQASGCQDVAVILLHPPHISYKENKELRHLDLGLHSFHIFPLRQSANLRQRLMIELEAAVRFLARSRERQPAEELQQAELREFVLGHLGTELFRRLQHAAEQDAAIRKGCQRYPQFCVDLFNEAVRRLQTVAGEDVRDCPLFAEELRAFVEPLPIEATTNRLEHFETGWQLPEQRQRIVQLLERCKLPQLPQLQQGRSESLCQWVLDCAQVSQPEDCVEQVALQAIKILQTNEEEGYLHFVEFLASERLQFGLREAGNLPRGIVYRTKTMRSCFLSAWYYEFQEPQICEVASIEEEQPKEKEKMEQHLDFDEIMSRAEAVLSRCRRRQEEALRDYNGSSQKTAKSKSKSKLSRDAENHSFSVSRLVSVLRGSLGESQMNATGQVEFRWTPHLSSLVGGGCPDGRERLWRPYVNFNTRLTRKLSACSSLKAMRRGSSSCVLPVNTRHAPKTVQGGKWPIWRHSSMRPLLLPSSNLWTSVLSQRFYAPRLRPAHEDEEELVERRAVPQLQVTQEECEEEEQQLQRRRDGSRLRHQQSARERKQKDQEEQLPSALMTPGLASKWRTTSSSTRRHREQQQNVRMTTQTWRRHRRCQPSGGQRIQVVSELEGWRRSANHQPVPVFQGQPAEQEHLRHASCRTSARSMKDVQQSSKMVWEPEERSPWARTMEIVGRMPSIRAAQSSQSSLLMAQESRGKHHRLITKELVYRPIGASQDQQAEEDQPTSGGGGIKRRLAKRGAPERALLQQHLADLLASTEPNGSFRIGYQPNAPTRQLLEQGKCHVSLRREQFIHLPAVLPKSLIQAADLEVRESPRRESPATRLHRKDGAKRPRPVEVVVKPSLLTVIRQEALNWEPRLVRNAASLEVKKLPQVSKLATHPFKDLEEPRIRNSQRSRGQHPGKRSTTRDMTEGYFLAKRSSSTAIKQGSSSSSKKVRPPRQPVQSPKVQVPSVQRKQRAQEKLWR